MRGTTEWSQGASRAITDLRARHAYTDLYDEERRTFTVQYPVSLVVSLALAGVIAVALTGFLGYSTDTPLIRSLFSRPWALFLWISAWLVLLQVSVLRHPSLRRQLLTTLTVSTVSIVLVAVFVSSGAEVVAAGRGLAHGLELYNIIQDPRTQALANFGVITLFGLNAIIHWVRWAHELPPPVLSQRVDLESNPRWEVDDLPTMKERVAADLFTGVLLLLVLAALFRATTTTIFGQALSSVDACSAADSAQCHLQSITLQVFDLVLAAIAFLASLVVFTQALALNRASNSMLGGVDHEDEMPLVFSTLQAKAARRTQRVRVVLHNVLQCMQTRLRIRILSDNLAVSLRGVLWPALILLSFVAAAGTSRSIQIALHSDKTSFLSSYEDVALALCWGILSVVSTPIALSLLLFQLRVAENTLRFLGLIGFTALLTFWIFSLTLWGINILLLQLGVTTRHPFDPPGLTTFASIAALLLFGVLLLSRVAPRGRSGPAPKAISTIADTSDE